MHNSAFRTRPSVGAPPSRRHRGDLLLVLFMCVLMLLGLVVIYSISPALTARINAGGHSLSQNHFMYRQLGYLIGGIVAFIAAYVTPAELLGKLKGWLLAGAAALCLVPILAAGSNLALCANGACRWINLGFISFQPAEFLKLMLIIFAAAFMARRVQEGTLNNTKETLWPLAAVLGVVALLVVVLQKDLGTGIAMFGIMLSMLYVAGLKFRYVLAALAAVAGAGALLTVTSAHRIERVMTFLNPAADTGGMSYHINQALIAIGSGGVTGKGLGRSVQAFGYLPEAANDSIFAIVAEKFGFLGTLAVLVLFALLLLRILRVMDMSTDGYFKLIVAGVFGWIATHTIVNIGAMLGLLPLTGITLPFLSFGGTSLIMMMAALGLVLNISRYTTHQRTIKQETSNNEDSRRRGRIGRARYAGSGRY